MKTKYRKRIVLPGLLLFFLLSACSDWLNVEQVDKYTESQVFSNEHNIQQALNGIYIRMGQNSLYGRDLSSGAIDLLGQQHVNTSTSTVSAFQALKTYFLSYNYVSGVAKKQFLSIWKHSYSAILDINNFIDKLEKTQGVVSAERKEILLGEAYGLRAYLHLDLLRLFGPVYPTDSTAISIPYRTEPKIEYNERMAATQVMSKIISDLDKSVILLKNDPVITEGVMTVHEDSLSASQKEIDTFYRNRNRRMNYYAAGALKVRALMYRGDKQSAADLAKSLLDPSAIPDKFPWATLADVARLEKEDRIFSCEVLFGVHSTNMYSIWTTYYSPGITSPAEMCVSLTSNLEKLFEVSTGEFSNATDWRSKNWLPYTANAEYMVSFKFSKPAKETGFLYFQPLIRKAELYYVLAECEEEVGYLNEVRRNRMLKNVEEVRPNFNLDEEILNEFRREMYNEGQIFYFYKRRNARSIHDASSTGNISMNPAKYVAPVPQSELDK